MIGRAKQILMPSGVRIISITGGVVMKYPCGTRRFIRDSWYEDVDFGPGNVAVFLSKNRYNDKQPIIYSIEHKKHYSSIVQTMYPSSQPIKNYFVHVQLTDPKYYIAPKFTLPPYEYLVDPMEFNPKYNKPYKS